jgi:carbonic anhydrase
MDSNYRQIFENNQMWLQEKTENNEGFFTKLAANQNPEFLYIGCSDSRVTAEEFMGLKPGQLFVHRNIANVISTLDLSSASVIQYAVEHLKVKRIIVCGHYNCGGVKAAMASNDLGILNPWLCKIRDVYRLHQAELDSISDEHLKFDRLVELNVQEQCINVIKTAVVQKHYMADGFPTVHGWVFDLRTGKLIDLKIDFNSILKDIQKIYNLNPDWNI